jgi:hypothetical protein
LVVLARARLVSEPMDAQWTHIGVSQCLVMALRRNLPSQVGHRTQDLEERDWPMRFLNPPNMFPITGEQAADEVGWL